MRCRAQRARACWHFDGALGCALSLIALGCAEQQQARWLEVERVEPALLEPGSRLEIDGSGFAAGQPCEVRLEGRSVRPGLPPLDVAASLPARALSDTQAVVALSSRELARLGGHGSFEGTLELSFAARGGGGRVSGERAVRVDISTPFARGAQHEQRLREQALQLLAFAGIDRAEEASSQTGLLVRSVRAGSVAHAIGLRDSDLIARAGGVSVHALADLAPPPAAASLPLLIERTGARAPLELHLPLHGWRAPDLGAQGARIAALLAWLISCALLLGPWPSAADALLGVVARVRRAPAAMLGVWGGDLAPAGTGQHKGPLGVAWPVALSVLGAVVVWLEPAGFLAVRSLSLYLGLCAVGMTLSLLGAGARRDRVRAALAVAGRMVVMGVLIACACALSGTRTFDGMVAAQGAWPWSWALVQKPALLAAFPLYIVFANRLSASTLAIEPHGRAGQLLVLERVLTNVVLCSLGVAIFAGGWQHPAELLARVTLLDAIDPRLCGALLYVFKVWGFALLLSSARRIGFGDQLRRRAISALCSVAIALTALWLWLEPSPVFELTLGRACWASALVVVAVAVARGLAQKWRTGSAAIARDEPVR